MTLLVSALLMIICSRYLWLFLGKPLEASGALRCCCLFNIGVSVLTMGWVPPLVSTEHTKHVDAAAGL